MEPEETTVARQRLGKHVPNATNTQKLKIVACGVFYAVRAEVNPQL
jgi:hypothetical protein